MNTIPSARLYGLGPLAMIEVLREQADDFDHAQRLCDLDMETKAYRHDRLQRSCMDILVHILHGHPQAQAQADDWRLTFEYYAYGNRVLFADAAWQALGKRLEKWRKGFQKIAEYESERSEIVMMRPKGMKSWRFVAARTLDEMVRVADDYDPYEHWHAKLGIDELADEFDMHIETIYCVHTAGTTLARALFGNLRLHEKMPPAARKIASDRLDGLYGVLEPVDDEDWEDAIYEAEEHANWMHDMDEDDEDDEDAPMSKSLEDLITKCV